MNPGMTESRSSRMSGPWSREKRNGRSVLIVFCILACASFSCGQDRIDLPHAIEQALKQNKTLAVSILRTKSAILGVDAAEAPFGVKLTPNNSAGVSTGRGEASVGIAASKKLVWGTEVSFSTGLSKSVIPSDTNDVSLYQGSIGVELRQPLLRGLGEMVNTEDITLARSKVAETRRLVEMMKVDLVVETVRTYVELLHLRRQKESAGESAVRMERLSKLTKAMERRGGTTRIDTLRSELQFGQALAQVESYGQEYDSKMRDFAELLGVDTDSTFDLEQVPFVNEELPDPGKVEDIALQHRLDYAQSVHDLRDAERGGLVARNRVLPDLALTLKYQRLGSGAKMSDATDVGEHFWFIGLSSTTDLLRKEERIAYRQSAVNGEVAARNLEIMDASIRKQSRQAVLAYKRGINELKLAKRNFDLAKARAVLTRKMFEIGRTDNFSVTDAEMAYLGAENQLLQSESDATLAGYRLRRTLGTLLEVPPDLLFSKETPGKETSKP
ncbi:MAG: hypothetical protein C0404_10945 [Verrucomicrobia bacterium]|nr:hypothetical protein [Verrucomicrobiota bacterium]